METTTLDLSPQTARVARLVNGVRDDQLGDPTPCDGTSVAGMLDHLVGLTTAFAMGARKEAVTGAPRAAADQLPPDWRDRDVTDEAPGSPVAVPADRDGQVDG